MAVEAAIRAVCVVLDAHHRRMTALEVRDAIGWWTIATIEEAIEALVAAGSVREVDGKFELARPGRR